MEVNAFNNIPNSTIYYGKIQFKKKILWLINSSVTFSETTVKTPQVLLPLDGAPGGLYNISNIIDMLDPTDIKQPDFCFVPTVSALALNNWESVLTTNLQGQDLFAQGATDFEYISYPLNDSERHTLFYSSNSFLINQLKDKPIYPNSFQVSFCGTQTLTIKNPLNHTLYWTASDNAFSVTSPTNTSAVITSAPVLKSAVLTVSSGNLYTLKRRLVSTCNLSISGPSTLCGEATYSIGDLPPAALVQWSSSNDNLILVSSEENTATFRKNGNGESIIQCNISINGLDIPLQHLVWLGVPLKPISIECNSLEFLANNVYDFTVITDNSNPDDYFEWKVSGGRAYGAVSFGQGTKNAIIVMGNTAGPLTISVKVRNSCGWSSSYTIYVMVIEGYGSYSLYPNPATDMVTVELQEVQPENTGISAQRTIVPTRMGAYEIQLWSASAMLRRYTTDQPIYQIPVSGLPAGIYFVRVIKDGQIHTKKLIKR